MARSSLIVTTTLCLILLQLLQHRHLATAAQYTNDDSDYNDFDYYKDLPEKRVGRVTYRQPQQDDFYMVGDPGNIDDRNKRVATEVREELAMADDRISSREAVNTKAKWPLTERVYHYTKHRIPGYDYDELDFLESQDQPNRCDERSVYTNYLCQFTCSEPNVIDCYSPYSSGCECRENYVYDERTDECVVPEQCQPDDDYLLY